MDSSVRSIWTYLTASPCYTTNTNKHDNTTNRQTDRQTDRESQSDTLWAIKALHVSSNIYLCLARAPLRGAHGFQFAVIAIILRVHGYTVIRDFHLLAISHSVSGAQLQEVDS